MDDQKRGFDKGVRAARECGAEWQANPGESKSEYLNSAAFYFGKDSFRELSPDERAACRNAFDEGVKAERKCQQATNW